MGWTDERVELLKRLWAEGLSASQIAAELGGVTRNAVIGKVHRLQLSGRAKSGGGPRPRRPRAQREPRAHRGRSRSATPRSSSSARRRRGGSRSKISSCRSRSESRSSPSARRPAAGRSAIPPTRISVSADTIRAIARPIASITPASLTSRRWNGGASAKSPSANPDGKRDCRASRRTWRSR